MFQKSQKGPVLMIRHGETDYNKILLTTPQKEAQLNEAYIDCPLSEEGKRQAYELSKKIEDMNIKYVFTSPLKRCLETVSLALQSHIRKKDIKVLVHPSLTEVIHSCHDVSRSIQLKKELFNKDSDVKVYWNIFDNEFPANQDLYFLKYMDNCEASFIENLQQEQPCENLQDGFFSNLLSTFILNNRRPESLQHLYKRTNKFLKYLKDFMELEKDELTAQDRKILIVTHSAVIRMSTSEKAQTLEIVENYPDDCYKPDNCEVISLNMEKIS